MTSLPLSLSAAVLMACTPKLSGDTAADQEPGAVEDSGGVADSGSGDPGVTCRGDALEEEVPYSADLAALTERWNTNEELLRGLFIGSPT